MIHQFELPIIEMLQNAADSLGPFWSFISFLGDETFYMLFMPLVYWCVDALAGFRIGVVLLLNSFCNGFLKMLFRSPRPYWISDNITPGALHGSFGLPSGHAQGSIAVWGWTAVEVKKRWVTLVLALLVFLIGFSRLVLGVHFITDVLVGWLLGALLIWIFARHLRQFRQNLLQMSLKTKLFWAFLTTVLMILLPVLVKILYSSWQIPADWLARAGEIDPLSLKGALTNAGLWFGMTAGFSVLLHKKGILRAKQGDWQKLVRYLLGILGVFVLYAGLGRVFPRDLGILSLFLRFLRYALVGLWVSWWSPVLFQKLGIGVIDPSLPDPSAEPGGL
jgi:membrane-associated phospholipid phosphatase